MSPIIPISRQFDQPTLDTIIDADPIVQRYRVRFALFDWSAIDPPRKRGRAYLLDHPLLVLELGFRPHLDLTQPYGFDVKKTVPSVRHLNNIVRALDPLLLANLFAQSVQALQADTARLG